MKARRVLCLILAAGGLSLLLAQVDRGTIEGLVGDASGAAVPQAVVRIIRLETNDVTQLITNEVGRYFAPNLALGTYAVEVEREGFRTARRAPIILRAQLSARADFSLEVGALSERVEVSAQPPMVDASTATTTSSMTTKYINEMPFIYVGRDRKIIDYLRFLPGLTLGDQNNPAAYGAMRSSNEFFVDGAPGSAQPNQQGGYGENSMAIEHVGEFNVVTNAFNAEYGRTGNWFASVTTRSGTNQLHGSMFDYFANDKLNARGFFPSKRAVLHQNEGGFTLGAPIKIPKIYDGTNKTFFFFGQQLFYKRSLGAGNLLTIPTMAFRAGDFSKLTNAAGNVIPIFDPGTQRPDGTGGFIRDQFPGNQIPANRISPVSQKLMALMPPPDLPNAQSFNYYNRTGTDPKYDWHRSEIRFVRLDGKNRPQFF